MKLLTKAIENKLKKQKDDSKDIVVKFFNPTGAGTWLITSMDEDNDTMWGLCDLGFGCVEYGAVSLRELQSYRSPFGGLGIERDIHFRGGKVEDYADKECLAGT